MPLFLFKVKLTNAVAILLFFATFIHQPIRIPKDFCAAAAALAASMLLSTLNSPNWIASASFTLFFLFNFFFYFLLSYQLPSETVFKIYSASFYCTGFYALAQVFLSFFDITLPGVTQYIGQIARGSAFAYEPSFYALYMTPFTMYCNARYILSDQGKLTDLIWPNLFLLASTSTGCFFSYLFFLFFLILFHLLRIIDISLSKIATRFVIAVSSLFALFWTFNKDLILTGLLKFFYSGGLSHYSLQDRWRGLVEYWNIFLENPLVGVGFGSGPFYLARENGLSSLDLLDPEILADYSPMNVTTEVLASMGLVGGVCFLFFFYFLIRSFRTRLRLPLEPQEQVRLIALALSICVVLATLQFNQSIMRAYLWIHIGLFCGLCHSKPLMRKNSILPC